MTKLKNEFMSESNDNTQVAGILFKLIWTSWCAYLFLLIIGFFYKDWNLIKVVLIGGALLFIPFILVRKGLVQLSSFITIWIVIGTVTYVAMVGEGIRDIAIISFPIIIIFAGLTLNRLLFGICVGLTIVAAIGLVFGEAKGWFVTKPFDGPNQTFSTSWG